MNNGNEEWLLGSVEELLRENAEFRQRLEIIEQEVANSVKRRDSIEVGTPAKGGALKVYFDSAGTMEENNIQMAEAKRMLVLAGGSIPEPKPEVNKA